MSVRPGTPRARSADSLPAPPRPLSRALNARLDRRTILRSAAFLGVIAAAGPPVEETMLDAGVDVTRGWLESTYLPGPELRWRLAVPRNPRGLVLALHGKGSASGYWFHVLDGARIARETGLAIAAIDGGRSYWHPRADSDASAMLRREFLPLLASRGLPTERIGLTGVSMGGYGALHLAGELGPARVFGVATMSAALRRDFAATSRGAFDDAANFALHSIFARTGMLSGIPVSLACGTADRFYGGNVDLARLLPRARTVFGEGAHTTAYCREHWGPQMGWLADRV